MEALQPPSAAAPAPGAQMAPERRAGAQARYEPNPRTCGRLAGTLCESDGGGETVRTKAQSRDRVIQFLIP